MCFSRAFIDILEAFMYCIMLGAFIVLLIYVYCSVIKSWTFHFLRKIVIFIMNVVTVCL